MTAVETRPAVHSAETSQALEGPLPQFAARNIIDQFKTAKGLEDATEFRIVTKKGTVVYTETPGDKEKKRPALRTLTVFSVFVTAGAIDSEDGGKIGWAERDGKSTSGAPTHHEDILETAVRINKLLSLFLPEMTTKQVFK